MRLLVLFLVCSIGLTYAADSYAQKALISIDVRNQRVEDILKEIEEQSDFDFFFNNKHVDLNRRVSVSADKSNIFSVLKEIFSGTNVKYSVLDKKIIFRNTPLEEGLRMLEKRYNVEFIIKNDRLKGDSFTGTFTNQRLERILEYFQLSSQIRWRYLDSPDIKDEKSKIEIY